MSSSLQLELKLSMPRTGCVLPLTMFLGEGRGGSLEYVLIKSSPYKQTHIPATVKALPHLSFARFFFARVNMFSLACCLFVNVYNVYECV